MFFRFLFVSQKLNRSGSINWGLNWSSAWRRSSWFISQLMFQSSLLIIIFGSGPNQWQHKYMRSNGFYRVAEWTHIRYCLAPEAFLCSFFRHLDQPKSLLRNYIKTGIKKERKHRLHKTWALLSFLNYYFLIIESLLKLCWFLESCKPG